MLSILLLVLNFVNPLPAVNYPAGYNFVDGRAVSVIKFTRYRNLIVVPAQLNDTTKLNLILDTGIRTLILFSKKSEKLSNLHKGKKLKVSGRGVLESVECDLSFPNQIRLGDVIGTGIAAAVVTNNELAEEAPGIDGIIGYELFVRFCIRIDYLSNTITLFNEVPRDAFEEFSSMDLNLKNLRPEIAMTLRFSKKRKLNVNALIDTGSSFELLVYDSKRDKFGYSSESVRIGTGLAGSVFGYSLGNIQFQLGDSDHFNADFNLVLYRNKKSDDATASIGGGFLKNYVVMFDYPHSRFYIKPNKEGKRVVNPTYWYSQSNQSRTPLTAAYFREP